jgi:hypothetical protein
MPANSTLDPSQVLTIATYLNSVGNSIRNIFNDPNMVLSNDQSNLLASDLTTTSNAAANLATWAAQLTFADSDGAFTQISNATQSAATKLSTLQSQVAKISSFINIVAAVVTLGTAFGSGDVAGVLNAASGLYTAVSSA